MNTMPLQEIPAVLEERGGAALQWEALRERIAGRTQSPLGQGVVRGLEPSGDPGWIETQQGRTAEMRALLASGESFSFRGLMDVEDTLAKARIPGAALEAEELLRVLSHADRVEAWRQMVLTPPDAVKGAWPEMEALSAPLLGHDLAGLLRNLKGKIEPDGSLSDEASPELNRIRRALGRQHQAIETSLKRALERLSADNAVQDALITVRGDRFVIPIKVEAKRRVPGVVHGTSSTGQTVFVEPMETIEGNNELQRLLGEEQAEIHRILLQMTRAVGAESEALQMGAEVLAEADAHAATARFAEDFECVRPVFSPEDLYGNGVENRGSNTVLSAAEEVAPLELLMARHPLLEMRLREQGGAVVPLTIALPAGKRQMIISGPNTGRQDRGAEDGGAVGRDGAGGDAGAGSAGPPAAVLGDVCRYRRRAVAGDESFNLFRRT